MSTDNLIEIARQADQIIGDQDDGFEGFEAQLRGLLARSDTAGGDPIEMFVDDMDAALFMLGHELLRSSDGNGGLRYAILEGRPPFPKEHSS